MSDRSFRFEQESSSLDVRLILIRPREGYDRPFSAGRALALSLITGPPVPLNSSVDEW